MNGFESLEPIYRSERVSVFRAIRNSDRLSVIIKTLNSDFPGLKDLTRFQYEYEISKTLSLPGVVKILDLQKEGNKPVLVLEDVRGIPLGEFWKDSPKTLEVFLNLAIQITEILSILHKENVVHKDIKPANILVQKETEKVYLIDLGLASLINSEEQAPISPETLEGTLSYISPEQTGRMNRSIDFRTDLYSLGITFFELLTGRLPFISSDPIELIHSHIAISPISPGTLNSNIPPSLSNLILKLLSKNPEDRYRSADGLKEDLELSLLLLNQNKLIEFNAGERESKRIFSIPERLYGREAEVIYLLREFERISESTFKRPEVGETESFGGVKLVLVGGYSGVGKTALLRELHKPILEKKGMFLSGKFEEYKRNIPYYSLTQAFSGFVRQILSNTEESLKYWKKRILGACGKNTGLLLELIPELLHITGTLHQPEALPTTEAEERFQTTLLQFLGCIGSTSHPLVLFFDDLQWADSPTLKFIEEMTKSGELHHILLLGAYRDNEVDSLHPLTQLMNNLNIEKISFLKIILAPLPEFFIERMICDTILREDVQELTQIIFQKTGGNPFFTRKFLQILEKDGLIFYSSNNSWEYDSEKIQSRGYSENVIVILAKKLLEFPDDTLESLKIASCAGTEFSLILISEILNKSTLEIARSLRVALREGIILALSSEVRSSEVLHPDLTHKTNPIYRFSHDKLQEAVYSLLETIDKINIHTKIGNYLVHKEESLQEEKLFEIVGHLNFGLDRAKDEEEKEKYLNLNFRAGKKALESYSYESAVSYFQKAISLWGEGTRPEIKFQSKFELLQARYKLGYVNEVLLELGSLLEICTTRYEKALTYNLKVICETNIGEIEKSIDTCIEVLHLFEITLKLNYTDKEVFLNFLKVQKKLKDLTIDDLFNFPLLKNREIEVVMEILMNTANSGYNINQKFSTVISLLMVSLSIEYGNSFYSSYGYSIYAVTLSSIFDYKKADEFSNLSLKLCSKFPNNKTQLNVALVLGTFVNHWNNRVNTVIDFMVNNCKKESKYNDIFIYFNLLLNISHYTFLFGKDLNHTENLLDNYLLFFKHHNLYDFYYFSFYIKSIISKINLDSEKYYDANGVLLDKLSYEKKFIDSEIVLGKYVYFIDNSYVSFLLKDYSKSYEYYLKYKPIRTYGTSTLYFAHDYFVSSLVLLKTLEENSDPEIIRELESYTKQYKLWSENNPGNFKHKYNLILAEYSRTKKEFWEAGEYYDIALESAGENEYNLDAGLCAELCGEFYLEVNRISQAKKYFLIAIYYYELSGAKGKSKQVRELYPEYTTNQVSVTSPLSVMETSYSQSIQRPPIDITSVLRATTALSEERDREALLSKLMKILVENAGATRTVLLEVSNDTLKTEAEYSRDKTDVLFFSSEIDIPLPNTLLQYIRRTGNSLLFDDIEKEEKWKDDPYFQGKKKISVLSFPIFHRGNITGILYLENSNTIGAFSKERLNVLQMISSQATISLENAKLYKSMENKIQERTRELEEKNKSIEELNLFIKSINESADLDFILDKIHSHIKKNFQIEHFGLGIAEKDSKYAKTVYLTYPDNKEQKDFIHSIPIPVRGTKGAHSLAFDSNKPFYVRRIRLDRIPEEERQVVTTFNLKSILILPLILKGENIGYFDLFNGDKELLITKEEINQLSILAEQLAGIIYSSNLYKELEAQKQQLESTLTELRSTQEQLVEAEKTAALGHLISGVAHEINNPLAAIRSSAETLERDQDTLLSDLPNFFQNSSKEVLSLFLKLQIESFKNRRVLSSREERQRRKLIQSRFENLDFQSSEIRLDTIELLSELFLEDEYSEMRGSLSEEEAIQILKKISLFATQRIALKNIKLSTEKSARVIFSLRKYLGTDIKGTMREVKIADLLESSLQTYENYIRGIITIQKNYSSEFKTLCVVDEVQQVFKHILFNSIQSMFTTPKKVLHINVEKILYDTKEEFKIIIEDTGNGISVENQEKLFTPFFTTKSRGEGIGLGLYVSKLIVEEHGGRLEYEPGDMGSTRISIYLKT